MKNYIIFYTAIIVFVIGGIKWTSYILEKKKNERREKPIYHQQITGLLLSTGKISPTETLNKNIVIYYGYTDHNKDNIDFIKLNELTNKYADNTAFYMLARNTKKSTESFFTKNKIRPEFKVLYQPEKIFDYIRDLSHSFYLYTEEPALLVVISHTGKIELYKWSGEKDLLIQVQAILKE